MSTRFEQPPKDRRPEGSTAAHVPAFIRRHAVLVFYVLAFAISWGAILLAVGPDGFSGTGSTIVVAGSVSLAGPGIAGLLMTGIVDGRAGFHRLGSRLRRWRVGVRWYAVALLTGPLVMCGTVFGLSVVSPDFRPDIVTADDKLGIVVIGIAVGLMVGFFEELGWTGFALPRLRLRHGMLATGLGMGLLWGVWHFPFFAGTTDPTATVPAALVIAVFLFAWLPPYRVLMVWVYDRTESLLLAMLMHAPISSTTFVLATEAKSAAALLVPVLVWGAAFWVIVAVMAYGGAPIRNLPHRNPTRTARPTRPES